MVPHATHPSQSGTDRDDNTRRRARSITPRQYSGPPASPSRVCRLTSSPARCMDLVDHYSCFLFYSLVVVVNTDLAAKVQPVTRLLRTTHAQGSRRVNGHHGPVTTADPTQTEPDPHPSPPASPIAPARLPAHRIPLSFVATNPSRAHNASVASHPHLFFLLLTIACASVVISSPLLHSLHSPHPPPSHYTPPGRQPPLPYPKLGYLIPSRHLEPATSPPLVIVRRPPPSLPCCSLARSCLLACLLPSLQRQVNDHLPPLASHRFSQTLISPFRRHRPTASP